MRQDFQNTHRERNRETAGLADSFLEHRTQVMALIAATVKDLTGTDGGECSSIVLLGAGNCLDVDLPQLATNFQQIHLVDVDPDAVNAAVRQSGVASRCIVHAPTDIADPLLSLTSRDFRSQEDNREHCIGVLQKLTSDTGVVEIAAADVVVSLCVFSQVIHTLSRLLGTNHPAFTNALKALRMGHLRRLLKLLRPGGVAIFVSDVVSSETSEELKFATKETTPELVKKLVNEGNFFSGTNPALMLADLNLLTRLPGGPESVHTIDPWPWQMGDRTYAVYAFRIQKALPVKEDATEDNSADEAVAKN